MAGVMILFAFSMSLVINLVKDKLDPEEDFSGENESDIRL
jgi:hypothetical protein